MQLSLSTPIPPSDLAGRLQAAPNSWQMRSRVHHLINRYLGLADLNAHLAELPDQFTTPQARPWQRIQWKLIHRNQIIGIDPDIFLAILQGAIDTEAPIRDYTQTSRQYLASIHPQMAQYVGGTLSATGDLIEPGLWEKEERQHTPAMLKLYQQITGRQFELEFRTVRAYSPSADPIRDLYRHGMHRIATEYGAVCLYLWMMAHTTGPLQAVLAELVQDEVNHMTKFWGFGLWLFPESHRQRAMHMFKVITYSHGETSSHRLRHTLHRMKGVLHWQAWQQRHQVELAMTFIAVLRRLHQWSDRLSQAQLKQLLGTSPLQIQSDA